RRAALSERGRSSAHPPEPIDDQLNPIAPAEAVARGREQAADRVAALDREPALAKGDRVADLLALPQRQRQVAIFDDADVDDLGAGAQVARALERDAVGAERLEHRYEAEIEILERH